MGHQFLEWTMQDQVDIVYYMLEAKIGIAAYVKTW